MKLGELKKIKRKTGQSVAARYALRIKDDAPNLRIQTCNCKPRSGKGL